MPINPAQPAQEPCHRLDLCVICAAPDRRLYKQRLALLKILLRPVTFFPPILFSSRSGLMGVTVLSSM